jgi:RNA polymerase sigma-70 factor (ECF subfamily)
MMALVMSQPEPARIEEVDRAVLDRARASDPIAMRAFVVRYQRQVFALLSRVMGPGTHVEDLAQETFLRAFRALPAFDPDGPARVSTWLLTIATRLALDERAAIVRAAAELSDDMRAAFVLADVHGFTMAEIAHALGIPENTAKTRVHRARLHMRERLAPMRREDHDERV